jgi:hypothetical protein
VAWVQKEKRRSGTCCCGFFDVLEKEIENCVYHQRWQKKATDMEALLNWKQFHHMQARL